MGKVNRKRKPHNPDNSNPQAAAASADCCFNILLPYLESEFLFV